MGITEIRFSEDVHIALESPNRFEFHVEHSKQNTTLSMLIENEPYVFLWKLLPKIRLNLKRQNLSVINAHFIHWLGYENL